jgi:hypothetical protein
VSGVFARSGNRCAIEVVARNENTCAGGCIVTSDSNFADWSGDFVVTRMTCNKFARVNESWQQVGKWRGVLNCRARVGGVLAWCGNKMRKRIERTWAGIGRVVR